MKRKLKGSIFDALQSEKRIQELLRAVNKLIKKTEVREK